MANEVRVNAYPVRKPFQPGIEPGTVCVRDRALVWEAMAFIKLETPELSRQIDVLAQQLQDHFSISDDPSTNRCRPLMEF